MSIGPSIQAGKKRAVKLSKEQQRSKEIIGLFTQLGRGLFGKKDYSKALKLRAKASDAEAAWLLVCLAQYEREMKLEPVEGIKLLAPHVLGEKAAKSWIRSLRTAENSRRQEWNEAKVDALREKRDAPIEPIGLALDFPKVAHFRKDGLRVPCALEVARCLLDLGKFRQSLEIITHYGKNFQGDALVLSFECLGDLYMKMRTLDKCIGAYHDATGLLKSLKNTEGYSEWQKVIQKRLAVKLKQAKHLMEIDRYGPACIAFRKAERRRCEDKLNVEAIWLYSQIQREFPKTMYSEASKCYTMKCLLKLASRSSTGNNESVTFDRVRKTLVTEKAFQSQAKKNGVPKAKLEEIKKRIDAIEGQLATLKATPYGMKALQAAKTVAKLAVKENVFGLYRGEMLLDLANFSLEFQGDEASALGQYEQCLKWISNAGKADRAFAQYSMKPDERVITTPPPEMRISKHPGIYDWATADPGDLLNRKTSNWYLDRLKIQALGKKSLSLFLLKDVDSAIAVVEKMKSLDKYEKILHDQGFPNITKRLMASYRRGFLYTPLEDLKLFSKNPRTMLTVADYYLQAEQLELAYDAYSRILSKSRRLRCSSNAKAYLRFVMGKIRSCQFRDEEALKLFDIVRKSHKGSSVWEEALFEQAQIYQQNGKLTTALVRYEEVIANGRKEDVIKAEYYRAVSYLMVNRKERATTLFKKFVTSHPKHYLVTAVNQHLKNREENENVDK